MKTVQDSAAQQIHVIRYQHLNPLRRLFGGQLMQWIDELAGIVALRHTGMAVNTVAVDSLVFKEPVYLSDVLTLDARLTYIGRTSMEVRVDSWAEHHSRGLRHVNRAYLVMVAINEEGRTAPVPPVELQTDAERTEWERGKRRYELRRHRQEEKF